MSRKEKIWAWVIVSLVIVTIGGLLYAGFTYAPGPTRVFLVALVFSAAAAIAAGG